MTVQEPDLAGFSEQGLKVAGEGRGRANSEREGKGSTCRLASSPGGTRDD